MIMQINNINSTNPNFGAIKIKLPKGEPGIWYRKAFFDIGPEICKDLRHKTGKEIDYAFNCHGNIHVFEKLEGVKDASAIVENDKFLLPLVDGFLGLPIIKSILALNKVPTHRRNGKPIFKIMPEEDLKIAKRLHYVVSGAYGELLKNIAAGELNI